MSPIARVSWFVFPLCRNADIVPGSRALERDLELECCIWVAVVADDSAFPLNVHIYELIGTPGSILTSLQQPLQASAKFSRLRRLRVLWRLDSLSISSLGGKGTLVVLGLSQPF